MMLLFKINCINFSVLPYPLSFSYQYTFYQIEHLVNDAIEKGARLITGGKRHELGGNYFLPTILADVTDKMEIFHSEIFGPVVSIIRYD